LRATICSRCIFRPFASGSVSLAHMGWTATKHRAAPARMHTSILTDDDAESGAPIERLSQVEAASAMDHDPRLQALGWAGDGRKYDADILDASLLIEGVPPLDGIETLDNESGLLLRRALPDPSACDPLATSDAKIVDTQTSPCRVREVVLKSRVLKEKGLCEWIGDDVCLLAMLLERIHPSDGVRLATLEALAELQLGAVPAMGAIVACLADPHRKVRELAARMLREIHAGSATLTVPYVGTIAVLAASHRSEQVRLISIKLLGDFEDYALPFIDVLRERLHVERRRNLRFAAACALSSLGDSEGADWVEAQEQSKITPTLTSERVKRMPVAQRPISLQAQIRREILREQLGLV